MPIKPRFLQKRPKQREDKKPGANAFHAVEIHCKAEPCAAARAARGQRYLSSEAPRLPLEGCTQPTRCQCAYNHRSDRRGGPRRNVDGGLPPPSQIFTDDRRYQAQRRAEDRGEGLEEQFGLQPEPEPEPLSLDDSYYDFVDTARLKRLKED